MTHLAPILAIGVFVSALIWAGAALAERFDLPERVVAASLQFAAGILVATVALDLIPSALATLSTITVVAAFFSGGVLFVAIHYSSARRAEARSGGETDRPSLSLHLAVLSDMVTDGIVIGVGSAVTLATGLRLGIALGIHQLVLTFVSTATAKRQGIPAGRRRFLLLLYIATIAAGMAFGYLIGDSSALVSQLLIPVAAGFLATALAQAMIPEAVRSEGPSATGIFFVVGMTLFGLLEALES